MLGVGGKLQKSWEDDREGGLSDRSTSQKVAKIDTYRLAVIRPNPNVLILTFAIPR